MRGQRISYHGTSVKFSATTNRTLHYKSNTIGISEACKSLINSRHV